MSVVLFRSFILLYILSNSLLANENWIELTGDIKINLDEQKVQVPIKVVNLKGGLEFIITIGTDKDYESVFAIECSGKELHLALETVSFTPQGFLDLKNGNFKLPSEQLQLDVKFEKDFEPIDHFLLWHNEKKVEEIPFYFCGSYFREYGKRREYAADLNLNIVAAYPSKEMIIGPLVKVANPYQEEQGNYLTPNAKVLPPVGTIGWLLIQKR